MMLIGLALVTLISMATAYPSYQSSIPNGDSVPDPCNLGSIWLGVGHWLSYGTGPRNPFGLDFASAGHAWTTALCMKDSDGDGETNGAELGDPNCQWTSSINPQLPAALSHPGICEPVGSANCTSQSFTCPT